MGDNEAITDNVQTKADAIWNMPFQNHFNIGWSNESIKNVSLPWIERNKRYAERYGFIDKPLKKGRRITKRVKVMSETSFPQQVRGIHCVRYSPDSESVAVGFGNGSIQIIDANTGDMSTNIKEGCDDKPPITSIKYGSHSSDLFWCSSHNGTIYVCQNKANGYKKFSEEPTNNIYCIDINTQNNILASGGKDAVIRLYDMRTRKIVTKYPSSEKYHEMRIYSVVFHHSKPNILATGGWDDVVKLWDIRTKQGCIKMFKGPHICGDAIDFMENYMITGAWVEEESIKLWDMNTGRMLKSVNPINVVNSIEGEFYYCTKFHNTDPTGNIILAVGSGRCALDVIDMENMKIIGSHRMGKIVLTLDNSDNVVFGGLDSVMKIVEVSYRSL